MSPVGIGLIIAFLVAAAAAGGYWYYNSASPAVEAVTKAAKRKKVAEPESDSDTAGTPTPTEETQVKKPAAATAVSAAATAATTGTPATPATTPIATTAATPAAAAPSPPAPPTYVAVQPGGWWDGNAGGAYKCPTATNVNLTGGNNDFANYCIFNTAADAEAWCSSDPTCFGYATNSGSMFQCTNNPVPNATANGKFVAKIPTAFAPVNVPIKSISNANMCLNVTGAATGTLYPLQTDTCNGGPHQNWSYTNGQLKNQNSGLCLDVHGANMNQSTEVGQYPCTANAANQLWLYASDKTLRTLGKTNMCLNPKGGTASAGTSLEIWPCNGATSQQWTL